jgi:uncharacterized repeat protein (TIGR03803 family)
MWHGRHTCRPSPESLETRLTPSFTMLASFGAPNGAYRDSALIMDSNGNLYGTTYGGGGASEGTVFELAHGSASISTLASVYRADGENPLDVIMDSSGNLYGTTYVGGAEDDGTVFELAHGSGTITALASFDGKDGADPYAGLIMDSSGNLYGTTTDGGASGDGTVFELANGSRTITTLAAFKGSNGSGPLAGLVMDSGGDLYGTTYGGGGSSNGTVFEVVHGGGTITTLGSSNITDGLAPHAGLITATGFVLQKQRTRSLTAANTFF